MVNAKIVVLPGDGIGPEVVDFILSQPQPTAMQQVPHVLLRVVNQRTKRVHTHEPSIFSHDGTPTTLARAL